MRTLYNCVVAVPSTDDKQSEKDGGSAKRKPKNKK